MLSIVIPNYNKEQYLGKCIESVLNQTYSDFEIIVVDDCSTDKSVAIIHKYAALDSRIKPILLKKNGGVSRARNIGIQVAKGEYITMLDSDDFYYGNRKIEAEMKKIHDHGENSIAYSYRVLVDQNGNRLSGKKNERRYVSGNDMLYHFLTEWNANMYVQRDFIVKRNILIQVGMYNLDESYYEDYDLFLRLLTKCSVFYTGEFGTAYRIVEDGLSRKQKIMDGWQFRKPMMIRKKYISCIEDRRKRNKAKLIWYIQMFITELKIIRRKIYIRKNGMGI